MRVLLLPYIGGQSSDRLAPLKGRGNESHLSVGGVSKNPGLSLICLNEGKSRAIQKRSGSYKQQSNVNNKYKGYNNLKNNFNGWA